MKRSIIIALVFAMLLVALHVEAGDVPPDHLTSSTSLTSDSPAGALPNYDGCGGLTGVSSSNEAYEQEVVELVNAERAARDLPPLQRVSLLDEAARYHAADMGQDNYFNHDSYDRSGGSTVWVCRWYNRVDSYYSGWNYMAENIAAGHTTPYDVMYDPEYGWMHSKYHRENILSTGVNEIGVGYVETGGSTYTGYWVQDFGRRSDVYPLVIDREAATTSDAIVDLYVYGQGWAEEMRFRNDGGDWSSWESYSPNRTWTLGCGAGTRTVYSEVRRDGTVRSNSDTIERVGEEHHMAVSSSEVTFVYDTGTSTLYPGASYQVDISDTGLACDGVAWGASQTGSWFGISPGSGTAPATLTITPEGLPYAPGEYTGSVTITSSPAVPGSPHEIQVSLVVTELVAFVFLPSIARNN